VLKQNAQILATGLLVSEFAVWSGALALTWLVRTHHPAFDGVPPPSELVMYGPVLGGALVTWTAWSLGQGLIGRSYRFATMGRELFLMLGGVSLAALVALSIAFVTAHGTSDRLVLLAWAGVAGGAIAALRASVRAGLHAARSRAWNTRNLIVVGGGPVAERIADVATSRREWGLVLLGFVTDRGSVPGTPVLGDVSELPRILETHVVDHALFAVEDGELARIEEPLAACREAGVAAHVVLDFFPIDAERLELDDIEGFPVIAVGATRDVGFAAALKRMSDVLLSALGIVLAAPLLAAIAIAVRAHDGGPAVLAQRRVGLRGREFTLYKFRTMVVGAEVRQHELAHQNEMNGPVFKMRDDPRVTPIGRWLRRTSLDELPQLWNVLRGEMSVVGPRPPLPSEVARYERWQRRRLSVKPGLTCIWQVSGRNDVDFDTWMKLDLSYIDNWSLWLDLKILVLTVPAVLLARGAR
jgi:exopolysaccharide biosynthesis polyprenyl glycosylphosphotransferase